MIAFRRSLMVEFSRGVSTHGSRNYFHRVALATPEFSRR